MAGGDIVQGSIKRDGSGRAIAVTISRGEVTRQIVSLHMPPNLDQVSLGVRQLDGPPASARLLRQYRGWREAQDVYRFVNERVKELREATFVAGDFNETRAPGGPDQPPKGRQ